MPRKPVEYAIYRGEEFLDIGTAVDLSKKFEVSTATILFWASPTHLRRIKKKDGALGDQKIVIKIEEEEE